MKLPNHQQVIIQNITNLAEANSFNVLVLVDKHEYEFRFKVTVIQVDDGEIRVISNEDHSFWKIFEFNIGDKIVKLVGAKYHNHEIKFPIQIQFG